MSSSQLRGLGEIAEDETGPALAATYERLREALGVRFVPTVYRMLAVYEPYLTAATDALAGLLTGDAAERFAVQARARASRGVAEVPPPAAISLGPAKDDVIAILERYNRANPRNLLFAQALLPVVPTDPGDVMGPPKGSPPSSDDPESILADILESHGGFGRPGMWRELAEFPRVLARMWRSARVLGGKPSFQQARASIGALASEATEGIAVPDPWALGLSAEQVQEIESILTWFVRGIAAMIVEIEYLRLIVRP